MCDGIFTTERCQNSFHNANESFSVDCRAQLLIVDDQPRTIKCLGEDEN